MARKRNLLIILTQGLRSDALAEERAWPLKTPRLSALASRGVRLVAISACPAADGGMASVLSGLHARQHGLTGPRAGGYELRDALPGWLAEAGHHVAGAGCVRPIASMLDEAVVVDGPGVLDPVDCAYWRAMGAKGLTGALAAQRRQRQRGGPFEPDRLLLEPGDDIDGFIASEASRLLERMPADRPWALVVVFSGPGNDLPPPAMYDGVVEPGVLQDGFVPADFTTLDALAEPVYPRIMLQRLEPYFLGRIRADYLGRVSLIDHGVGRLWQALEGRADAGRTWALLGSDHGYVLGERGLIGSQSFLSGAVEVPLVLVPPPGKPAARRRDDEGLYSTVDLAATAAAVAGCDAPAATMGRSILPLYRDEPVGAAVPGGVLSEFNDRLMLETERYRVVFHRGHRRCLGLYDLINDPDERNNLVQHAMGRNLVDSMRQHLAEALLPLRAERVVG